MDIDEVGCHHITLIDRAFLKREHLYCLFNERGRYVFIGRVSAIVGLDHHAKFDRRHAVTVATRNSVGSSLSRTIKSYPIYECKKGNENK